MIQTSRFASLTLPLLMGLATPLTLEAETSDDLLPLVYQQENTGAAWEPPPLPPLETLPTIYPLPDPFAWSDGRGRSTDPADWSQRRAEIKAEIEHYEIGTKPGRPEDLLALYDGEELIVEITVGDETLALTASVTLPEGPGPFPAIIGIGWGTGSLPADIFTDRGVAQIAYNFSQVMAHTQTRGQEPIDIKFKNKIQYYNLTPFQKCLLIHQLKKLKRKYSICKKNVKFWSNLLPDLDIEVIQDYFFYYPVRLRYNGYHSHKIKEILKNMGLKQDDWFEGGIGSRSFDKKKINFRLQNFKYTKKFCSNYTNLPTLINLSKNFKEEVTLKMNSKK